MAKKIINKNVFITKWEILTKNLVTFKRRDKVKGEKIVGVH